MPYRPYMEGENSMQVEIDKFGRLVIPSAVRNHLGIKPGSILELQEQGHEIRLRLIDLKSLLKRKGGVLVYTAEATDDIDSEDLM